MTQHSYQRTLNESEFGALLDACDELGDRFRLEAKFLIIALGRLGLRAGELAHFETAWINWNQNQIRIPAHEPCTRGRTDGICGYCRDRAEEALAHNPDLSIDQAWNQRWNPKTKHSVRSIPFDFDDRVREIVIAFDMYNECWPHSPSTISRRLNRALRQAGFKKSKTHPHALRATAAEYHAVRGVPPAALQSLFGWSQLSTAQKYVRLSGGATQRALLDAHS